MIASSPGLYAATRPRHLIDARMDAGGEDAGRGRLRRPSVHSYVSGQHQDAGDASVPSPHPLHPRPYGILPTEYGNDGAASGPASSRDKGRGRVDEGALCLSSLDSRESNEASYNLGGITCRKDKHKAPTLPRIRPLSLQDVGTSLPYSVIKIHQDRPCIMIDCDREYSSERRHASIRIRLATFIRKGREYQLTSVRLISNST